MIKIMKLNWSSMKGYRRRILIIPLCLLVVGWISPLLLIPMATFLLFSFSLNPFAAEEKGNLNQLYLTLPIKRRDIVFSRYGLSFLLFTAGILLGLVMMPLANLLSPSKWYPDLLWYLALISVSFLFYGLMSLAMYPFLFRMGYQKGKIWGYYLPAILTCLIYIAILEYDVLEGNGIFILNLLIYASDHIIPVICGMLGTGGILLALSCLLSVKIYSRREF